MVRYVNDNTGRFSERPHYRPKELDKECERIVNRLLQKRRGKAEFPVSTDDLEVLIEEHTEELDMYADLEAEYGADVEGVTEFYPDRKPIVRISKRLSENERFKNRLRTTLTHEFGHVHFHAYLWEMKFSESFGSLIKNQSDNIIVCKRDGIVGASKTDWMEWQAGYVCGAILMPASHLRKTVGKFFEQHNVYEGINIKNPLTPQLIEIISSTYEVSKEAARVRLSVLGHLTEGIEQTSLFR